METLGTKGGAPATPDPRLPKAGGPRLLPAPGGGGVAPASKAPPAAPPVATVQLPAHFQIPQGTVLIRSNTGQLMLVSQQALIQTQNSTSIWPIPANKPAVKVQTPQNSGTQTLKVLAAPVKRMCRTTHSVTSAVKKATKTQSIASTNSNSTVLTAKSSVTDPSTVPHSSGSPELRVVPKPLPDTEAATIAQNTSSEMLENVKKCKNFLATLIKLSSSGPQASEMGQNVKNLVQSLLEAKIEPEEFTKELYVELKSSPQPYLVPFLKKSLIALRQLTPNPQAFIQQCLLQSVPKTASCPTAPSTVSTVTNSTPVTTTSVRSARPLPRISPVGITSSKTSCPIPSISLMPRGSASLQLAQTVHALTTVPISLKGASPTSSAQLASALNNVKVVQPAPSSSATTVQATGNTSLQTVKPVNLPVMSSTAHTLLSSVKSVSSPLVATTVQTVKSACASASVTLATASSGTSVAAKPIMIRVVHPNSILSQTSQAVKVRQLIVQQPSEKSLKKVSSVQQASACPPMDMSGGKIPLDLIQCSQLPAGSLVKQITLPGSKILSFQASPVQRKKIRENGTTSFRDEDDINDVTSMAGVNLSEENACILRISSETVGTIAQSCPEELLLSSDALQKKILEIGKRHDITEVNSDVLNLISHATQERLRELLEKMSVIAHHRMMTCKGNDMYTISSDTRAQLRFLEQLDHVEKQRKDEEEREMLLRAAKSRSNKEDPEQLRLRQKAKEMQQIELAQMQQQEANRAALAAIGPRRKRPLAPSGFEDLNGLPALAKPCLQPRKTRICLRDLIFCMEQERELKHSFALYQALLK